jgi:PIN domain nuclease of toxin-antitoxin system
MRLLVDTHLLLWAAARSRRLPRQARELLEDAGNEVHFSAASLWEIAIKAALGKRSFNVDLAMLRPALDEMGFLELPVTGAHAEREFPPGHLPGAAALEMMGASTARRRKGPPC